MRVTGPGESEAFVDRRNPDPHIFTHGRDWGSSPDFAVSAPEWELPRISADLASDVDLRLPARKCGATVTTEVINPITLSCG